MEGKELSIALREMACNQQTPLCAKWTKQWKDETDIDSLLEKFVKGQDFCIMNDYPNLDFCRANFDKEVLHRHNIYLDDYVEIDDAGSGTWIFIGECEGEIVFGGFAVATLYVRHDSNIKVTAKGMAKVFISLYDEAEAEIQNKEYSTVRTYDRRNG